MPEFKLEAFTHPKGRPAPRVIFTKNEYGPKVKMPEWNQIKESLPKDNDPYDPPGGNQFLSTYNRIGHMTENPDHFLTTTKQMQEQAKLKEAQKFKVDKRPMINFLTFKETCAPRKPTKCTNWCATDYLSTMHDSYKLARGCVLKPLAVPKIPFLQNRKLKWEDNELDDNKFYDECFKQKVANLQKIKGFRTISYDPIKQLYSDGSPVKSRNIKFYDLPYNHLK